MAQYSDFGANPPPLVDLALPASYCQNHQSPLTLLVYLTRTANQLYPSTDIEPTRLNIRMLVLIPPPLVDLAIPVSYCQNHHPPLTPLVYLTRTARHLHPSTDIEPGGLDIWFFGLISPLLVDLAIPASSCQNYHPPLPPLVYPMRTANQLHPAPISSPRGSIVGFWG